MDAVIEAGLCTHYPQIMKGMDGASKSLLDRMGRQKVLTRVLMPLFSAEA